MSSDYIYPYPSYNFTLNILPFNFKKYDCSFQEISGLNATISTETIKEGGTNSSEIKLPTGTSWDPIVCKRGVMGGSALLDWVNAAVGMFTFFPMPGMINLKDNKGVILISWMFMEMYPISLKTSSLNALPSGGENSIMFETFELHHSGFTRLNF
jgi:phage tail-like protein